MSAALQVACYSMQLIISSPASQAASQPAKTMNSTTSLCSQLFAKTMKETAIKFQLKNQSLSAAASSGWEGCIDKVSWRTNSIIILEIVLSKQATIRLLFNSWWFMSKQEWSRAECWGFEKRARFQKCTFKKYRWRRRTSPCLTVSSCAPELLVALASVATLDIYAQFVDKWPLQMLALVGETRVGEQDPLPRVSQTGSSLPSYPGWFATVDEWETPF